MEDKHALLRKVDQLLVAVGHYKKPNSEGLQMSITQAFIISRDPARLMRRLCKHWSHKFPVELDEHRGLVRFPTGTCEFLHEAQLLQVRLAMTAQELPRMQQVVAEHLQRMAGDEPLAIQWCESLE